MAGTKAGAGGGSSGFGDALGAAPQLPPPAWSELNRASPTHGRAPCFCSPYNNSLERLQPTFSPSPTLTHPLPAPVAVLERDRLPWSWGGAVWGDCMSVCTLRTWTSHALAWSSSLGNLHVPMAPSTGGCPHSPVAA